MRRFGGWREIVSSGKLQLWKASARIYPQRKIWAIADTRQILRVDGLDQIS
jgi:hypothetical protein